MVFQNDILAGASGTAAGYTIDQSIRFDGSAYLSRTPASAGNRKTFTLNVWLKLTEDYSANATIIGSGGANDSQVIIDNGLTSPNTWRSWSYSGSYNAHKNSTQVARDFSAWYMFTLRVDTTEATAADRWRMYVNGEQITSFTTDLNPSLNLDTSWNQAVATYIGQSGIGGERFEGYMAEFVFIDGQALAPTNFGEYNNDGVWVPIDVSGLTFGSNGYHLDFADSSDLGKDVSGNSNDFTSSGLTSDDQVTDTPTDNYATLNAAERVNSTVPTISEGNTYYSRGSTAPGWISATQWLPDSGTYYWETDVLYSLAGAPIGIGVVNNSRTYNQNDSGQDTWFVSGYSSSYLYARADGTTVTNTYIAANPLTTNRLAHAYDGDTGKYWIGLVSGGSITWGNPGAGAGDPSAGTNPLATIADRVRPFVGQWSTSGATRTITATFYFDSTKWNATPPPGFSALSTANLPTPAIADGSAYFQTTLYTGNGTAIGSGGNAVSQIENSTFQPDFVWIKRRDSAVEHVLTDAVRGVTEELSSNDTGAEETVAEGLTTFGSSGFTVGSDGSYNTNTGTYAAWQWLAGNGTASNTDGTITSTVSANTTAGFSISTYTGTGSNATVGHGLGSAPSMVIVKNRTTAGYSWKVYHKEAGATYHRQLDSTAAFTTVGGVGIWNNTAPTSSVFSVGTSTQVNGSANNYVAYAFAEVEGFSKFGAYTGNGSADGPFVWCGFRPAYVLIKVSSTTGSWFVYDTARDTYNASKLQLFPNLTSAEDTSSTYDIDIVSNGFKIRSSNGNINTSSGTHIFMAFAEHPFGGDGVAPVPAR